MSGSNNLPVSYPHWKSNLSLIGSSSVAASTGYQNIIKMTNPSASSPGFMHQHNSPQLSCSEDHLMPAHSSHSPHSMNHIIGSPGSSTSLYSPGSNASSSAGCAMPSIIPRAHQHNIPLTPAPAHIQSSSCTFIDSQGHHIDIYSQSGMQRISQMFKANLAANNNNSNCNNKNATSNSIERAEQSMNNIKQLVDGAIGHEAKQQIMHILEKISLLQPPERLLLYLRMPSSTSETDPLRQPQNPLGTRSEISFTINWVRSHLEMDPNVSIPKQDVYEEYVTFCTREDVKPLSTADFGKVMKQIFPSIRPRRLGTRGNSRYCYAAMRKATKLECPQLPNLCDSKSAGESSGSDRLNAGIDDDDGDDINGLTASWKVIQVWAENLLDTEFRNVNELAKHITANYLNGNSAAINNSSRALLQKKILQRKVKGRKKKSMSMSEQELIEGKKRRKKKLKKSNSEQLDDNHSPASVLSTHDLNVPEMLKIKQEQKHSTDRPGSLESPQELSPRAQQTVPINLTNEHGKLKNECDLHGYSSNVSERMEMHEYATTICKIEIDEAAADVEQAICCKKVRAAQESKGFAVPSPKMPQHSPPDPRLPNLSPASMLMRPPVCDSSMVGTHGEPTDLSMNPDLNGIESSASSSTNSNSNSNSNSLQLPNKRAAPNGSGRGKRPRFRKHASVAGMNETKVDDISTDIIIPRERVVSICNMDKDALDDYLNEGGDSQEPEAELLQYFQPGTTSAHENRPTNSSATDTVAGSSTATVVTAVGQTTVSTTQAFPLLENYQLHQPNVANTTSALTPETQPIPPNAEATPKQIDALRQYLQENLHQTTTGVSSASISEAAVVDDGIVSSTDSQSNTIQMPINSLNSTHSAANSLTAISMPYQQTDDSISLPITVTNLIHASMEMHKTQPPPLIRSMSTSSVMQSHIEQSPNSRCSKHFSFVPISPRPQSPRISSNQFSANVQPSHGQNTFLSPRQSPAIRKTINKDLTNCLKQLQDPSISTYDTGFIAKNEISASAPASPSMTPHPFQFNKSHGSGYSGTSSSGQILANRVQQPQQQQQQPSHRHQASCSISGMCPILERSQSVPLHCQSQSAFSAPPISSTAYNSVCNSLAQTPVPSEFGDFNDDHLLDMLAESAATNEKNIKIEPNDLSNMMTTNRNIISRSVPSTPLPMNAYQLNAINNFGNVSATSTSTSGLLMTCKTSTFDASKSVPTTPNALAGNNNSTPFRYSPEHGRDFLLNGNVVDVTKSTQFYPVAQTSIRRTSPQGSHSISQHPSISSRQSNAQILLTTATQPMDNNLSHYNDVDDSNIADPDLINDM